MPPPTSSQKPNKAAAKEASVKAPAAATNGAKEVATSESKSGLTKPDQAKYNAEQDEINKEIAAVKAKMVSACPKAMRRKLI